MSIDIAQNSNKTIIDAEDLGASQSSEAVQIREAIGYSVQVVWTGGTGTTGSIVLEGTNYNPQDESVTPVYSSISSSAVAANSGDQMVNVERAMYSYFRLRWVRSAGTGGTITAICSVKNR